MTVHAGHAKARALVRIPMRDGKSTRLGRLVCVGGNAGRGRAKVRFDNGTYTSLPVDQVEMVDEAPRGVLAGPRCCP